MKLLFKLFKGPQGRRPPDTAPPARPNGREEEERRGEERRHGKVIGPPLDAGRKKLYFSRTSQFMDSVITDSVFAFVLYCPIPVPVPVPVPIPIPVPVPVPVPMHGRSTQGVLRSDWRC